MSDTDTYRARIVAALRAEADRIEAGGEPWCYALKCEDGLVADVNLKLDEARESLTVHCDYDDAWPDEVECQEWGVCVTIEEVARIAHRADLRDRFSEIMHVALVDPRNRHEVEVLSQDCPECEEEVEVAPGERCPVCEAAGAGGDEP